MDMMILHILIGVTYGALAFMLSLSKTGEIPYWRSVHLPQTDADERVRKDVNLAAVPVLWGLFVISMICAAITLFNPEYQQEQYKMVHVGMVTFFLIILVVTLLYLANKYEKKWKAHDRAEAPGYDDRPVEPH